MPATESRNWKIQYGGHFENDIPENQQVYGHNKKTHAILHWNSESNLTYAPDATSPMDGWMDRRKD